MARFYRDQHVANLTINEDVLTQLNAVFESRERSLNEQLAPDDNTATRAFLTYIIRFDSKGYRVFSLDEVLRYFRQAKEIERVIVTLETGESLRSNRVVGTHLEVHLDEKNPNGCYLSVTSDHKDWVDSSFSATEDVLDKCKNRNGWARSPWTLLSVQIAGVIFGFVLSLWFATKISPKLTIENSFVISFIFVLLIFSNMWTYLNQKIVAYIYSLFPNLKFYRPPKDRLHWLMQAVVGGIAVAVTLYVLGLVFSYIGGVLGVFINKGA